MSNTPPTAQEIQTVARRTVAILTSRGLSSCLFGSAGCSLYGSSRTPNDIDVVVMTASHTTEVLKELLARSRGFYLRPSKKPSETYKILFYRLKPDDHSTRRFCKVDILVPGIMNIPMISPSRIVWVDNLPVVPLIVLLLLKLQGWSDHRASTRSDMQQKQYVDIRDISQLVAIAARGGARLDQVAWLPPSFVERAREHLALYLRIVRPTSTSHWTDIGFDVLASS